MTGVTETNSSTLLQLRMLTYALIIGAFVGAIGWLVNLFLQHYFVNPVFCSSPDSLGACANGGTVAWVLAQLLVVGASLVAMVRFAIYRPLLIVIAVFATVWGIHDWLADESWWSGTLWQALIFALGYAAYAWLARLNQFWLASLMILVVVVGCRFVLSWA